MAMFNRSLPVRPVAKETVLDQVYRQIRDLILDGEIEPGHSVTIQSLADAFGVSAMPVREALHRLTAEKALTVIAGRSVGIAPLSLERLGDLRQVRLEIEGRPRGLAGSFRASVPFDLAPDGDTTRIAYAVEITVTGRLAVFGVPLLRDTLRRQVAQLVANLDRELGPG